MKVMALIMAGGRGERMRVFEEKPMVKVGGRPMIDWVVEAAKSARRVDDVIVAVSKHTPKTAERAKKLSVKVIETPGKDYHNDLRYVARHYDFGVVLTIAADLPLIRGEVLDEIVAYYKRSVKPALAVMVPVKVHRELGLEPTLVIKAEGRELVPVGINVLDGRKIRGEEQDIMIMERPNLAVNINKLSDVAVAEELLRRRTLK